MRSYGSVRDTNQMFLVAFLWGLVCLFMKEKNDKKGQCIIVFLVLVRQPKHVISVELLFL
jgi:hypothetical protein